MSLLVENMWFIHSDRPNFELQVKDSIISHGCFLRDCSVEHSIVGIRSRLESGAVLKVGGSFSFLLFLILKFYFFKKGRAFQL